MMHRDAMMQYAGIDRSIAAVRCAGKEDNQVASNLSDISSLFLAGLNLSGLAFGISPAMCTFSTAENSMHSNIGTNDWLPRRRAEVKSTNVDAAHSQPRPGGVLPLQAREMYRPSGTDGAAEFVRMRA